MNVLMEEAKEGIVVAAVISLLLGLLFCFFGYRLKKLCITLTGLFMGFSVGFMVTKVFSENTWLCIGVGVVCALVFAGVFFYFYLAGVFLLCALPVFLLLEILFPGNEWWFWILSILGGAAAGAAGVYFLKSVLIVCTGLWGGLAVSQAVLRLFKVELPWLSLVLAAVIAIAGIVFQFRNTKDLKDDDKKSSRKK